MTNFSTTSALTLQQKTVWQLISQDLSASSIASKLKTARQYVNQTRLKVEAKLSSTLFEVAQANYLQVTKLDKKSHLSRLPPYTK